MKKAEFCLYRLVNVGPGLVGSPEDRVSRVAALIIHAMI